MTRADEGPRPTGDAPPLRSRRWWLGAGGLLASALAAGVWQRSSRAQEPEVQGGLQEPPADAGLQAPPPSEQDESGLRDRVQGRQRLERVLPTCFIRGGNDIEVALMAALEYLPDHPLVLLLQACMALEGGHWEQARKHLEGPVLGGTPESRLLLGLLEHRPRARQWLQAFRESWQALGRPDFSESMLLPAPHPPEHFARQPSLLIPLDQVTPEQRYLLTMNEPRLLEGNRRWFSEQVRDCQHVEWLLVTYELLALDVQRNMGDYVRKELARGVHARLLELAGPSPQELRLALLPLLPEVPFFRTDKGFERQELKQLEQLVALPAWRTGSSEQTFHWLRNGLKGLLEPRSQVALVLTQGTYGKFVAEGLLHKGSKFKGQLKGNERRWLGSLLWEVGARLLEQRSLMERQQGAMLQACGWDMMGEWPTRDSWKEPGDGLHKQQQQLARAALDRWPLPQLQVELCEARARDELALLEAFAGG